MVNTLLNHIIKKNENKKYMNELNNINLINTRFSSHITNSDGNSKNSYKITRNKTSNYIYIDPLNPKSHSSTMIFLHGVGETAESSLPLFIKGSQFVPLETC